MRRRYVYDSTTGEMVERAPRRAQALHFIQDDLPGYESPTTGLWIEGRRARREDLKRSGCRPYEGFAAEKKEADKVRAEADRRLDAAADRMVREAWRDVPQRIRRELRGW